MRTLSAFQPNTASGTTKAYYPLNGNPAGGLRDGAVSYWKLDESSGNISDSVGSNTGTNSGVTFEAGKINNAALLGETNFFDCTNSATLQLTVFTFSAWVKSSDATNGVKTIIIGNSGASGGFQWRMTGTTSYGHQLLKYNVASIGAASSTVATNTWNHFAVTYNSSTGAFVFYTNGVADGSGTSAQTFSQNKFYIGFNSATEGYIGNIDEVGVWNRILSADEIATLYNAGAGRQIDGRALDYSGNANHGTETAITYPQGRFGQGAKFNGTSSGISIPDSTSLRVTNNFTVSVWVKSDVFDNAYRDIIGKTLIAGTYNGWDISKSNDATSNKIRFEVLTIPTTAVDIFSDSKLPVGWNNIICQMDAGTLKMYLNGKLQADTASGTMTVSTNPLYIGRTNVGSQYWSGTIDEVIIESRAWTAKEVETYYRKSVLNYRKGFWANIVPLILLAEKGIFALTGKTVQFNATLNANKGVFSLLGKTVNLVLRGWRNRTKNSSTWTNSTKNSATWTGVSKAVSNWTNRDKS